jgi:hypothetical protein
MKLSPKAIRFVIEALDHYQKYHDQRLQQEELAEDDAADLINDRQYIEVVKQDFAKYHDELVQQRQSIKADG